MRAITPGMPDLKPAEELAFASPIPTQIVSSDEYTPPPQSEKQKEVEARLLTMADEIGGRQGLPAGNSFNPPPAWPLRSSP